MSKTILKHQVDEMEELRKKVYEGLMEIGASMVAERIILNDLQCDKDFDINNCNNCVVGCVRGGDNYTPDKINYCADCTNYSGILYARQLMFIQGRTHLAPIATKRFLEGVISFVDHFKETHHK